MSQSSIDKNHLSTNNPVWAIGLLVGCVLFLCKFLPKSIEKK